MEVYEEVLVSLRQIIRATDLYSKKLKREFGLTSPQLLLMRTIRKSGNLTLSQLSKNCNMSQATATSILDRLEAQNYVIRKRDTIDKRKIHAHLTNEGQDLLNHAPHLIQDHFIIQFQALDVWEQNLILSTLQRVVTMMNDSTKGQGDYLYFDPDA